MQIVLLSDIHANYEALQAVTDIVDTRILPSYEGETAYWFLGDIVGYGPDPVECLKWLRNKSRITDNWVIGNHDADIYKAGQYLVETNQPPSAFQKDGVNKEALMSWQRNLEILLERTNRTLWEWFAEKVQSAYAGVAHSLLHKTPEDLNGELLCVAVHGSLLEDVRWTQYLYPWIPMLLELDLERLARDYRKDARTAILFHGHTHYPAIAVLGDRGKVEFYDIEYGKPLALPDGVFAINPGSVGQSRAGDPRATFAVLNTEDRTITFYRVMYNHMLTIAKLQERKYPSSLIHRLESGDGREGLMQYRSVYDAPHWQIVAATRNRAL